MKYILLFIIFAFPFIASAQKEKFDVNNVESVIDAQAKAVISAIYKDNVDVGKDVKDRVRKILLITYTRPNHLPFSTKRKYHLVKAFKYKVQEGKYYYYDRKGMRVKRKHILVSEYIYPW